MSGESLSLDPATLADNAALRVFYQPDDFERKTEDKSILDTLDYAAAELGLVDKQYWVEASRGIAVPVDYESDPIVRIRDYYNLQFEGTFLCYSKVLVGKIIGGASVRALCPTFHRATLLPYFEKLPPRHLLYVPVPAVNEIDRTELAA